MHIKALLDLTGKVILVTGGAGYYGQCIAEGLAEAGAKVVIASRNITSLEATASKFRSRNLDVHATQVDQGDHISVVELGKTIVLQFGKLDCFVNNAVSRPMKGYNAPIEQFAASMEINATGAMDILREMGEIIAKNRSGGSIINISSMMGMFGPDYSNYEGTG